MRLELKLVEKSQLESADQVLRQMCLCLLSRVNSLRRSADADVILNDGALEDFDKTVHLERVDYIR